MGISREQALDCFRSDDLIGMGMEADAVRRDLHPEGVVGYVLTGTVCCGEPGFEAVSEQIREIGDAGGTEVRLEVEQNATIENLEGWFRKMKERFPTLALRGCSVEEVLSLARQAELPVRETLKRLQDAGLETLSDDGVHASSSSAEYADAMFSPEDWAEVQRAAHRLGMQTTASMTLGLGEQIEDRLDYLAMIRGLQEETGGFAAFTLLPYSPPGTAQGREEVTSVEYLKTLAISRMYLHTIEHVQTGAGSYGLKVLQMGLRFGADDVGSVAPAQDGKRVPRVSSDTSEEEMRRVIRDAGFRPVQRDGLFNVSFLD